jgi:hypothetical protein
MGRTERRVLALGSIAFLLAFTAVGAAAAPAASDGITPPSSYPSASPAAFAEREAGQDQTSGSRAEGSLGHAVELMVLVAACGIVVALYSAMEAGRGGTRVLMRIRRR